MTRNYLTRVYVTMIILATTNSIKLPLSISLFLSPRKRRICYTYKLNKNDKLGHYVFWVPKFFFGGTG